MAGTWVRRTSGSISSGLLDTNSGWGGGYSGLTNIEVVDEFTLRLTNDVPSSVLPDQFQRTFIVAKENVSNGEGGTAGADNDFANPVGVGPYAFGEFLAGEKVILDRFEDYWQMGEDGMSLPYVDRAVIRTVADSTSLLAALKTGEVQLVWNLSPRFASNLLYDDNADAVISTFHVVHRYWTFEHSRTTGDNVFGDIRARRGLAACNEQTGAVRRGLGWAGVTPTLQSVHSSELPLGPEELPRHRTGH